MRIAIFGAGAMGSLIGGCMVRAGYDVSLIGRGAHLQAMQTQGLTLAPMGGEPQHVKVKAYSDSAEAGPHDAVIVCTKTTQLADAAPKLAPLLHDTTVIVPAVNGLPWWYFFGEGGKFDGRALPLLDPHGVIARHIPPARIIGCVNYLAGQIVRPGVVEYVPELERRIALGELNGEITPRLEALGKVFADSGFAPKISNEIRTIIWHKLWGNIAFNPLGALTHGTMDQLAEGYHDHDLLMAVMNEARFIADRLGIEFGQTLENRIKAASRMRGHKTSMLQDMMAGKPTEIDAIVGVVRDIGGWMQVDTPYLNVLYSLVRLKELFYAANMEAGSGQPATEASRNTG
jgi:2-dehydropantoate 2-reductase